MPSMIENTSSVLSVPMPTPESLKPGSQHINAIDVGPAVVNSVSNNGFSPVENAQAAAEQSYSAMASATAGGGQDPTVEFMLEQNGKGL